MSTLLDALKKSEEERTQQPVPVYNTMQPPEERSPVKKLLLILAIIIALCVIAGVIYYAMGARQALYTERANPVAAVDYATLSQEQRDPLVDLRINVISVSQQPGRSFAILGEELYREGDTVSDGVQLETIGKDFVVFIHEGKRIRRGLE